MHVVADTPDLLVLRPEHEAKLRAMVSEAIAAFGSRHFDHYEFLVALTFLRVPLEELEAVRPAFDGMVETFNLP